MKGDLEKSLIIASKIWKRHYYFFEVADYFDFFIRKIIIGSKFKVDTLAFLGDVLFRDSSIRCKKIALKDGIKKILKHHSVFNFFYMVLINMICSKIGLLFIRYSMMYFVEKFIVNKFKFVNYKNKYLSIQNLTILGESALSVKDINYYLNLYLYLIKQPHCNYLSLKLSALTIPKPMSAYNERLNQMVFYLSVISDACLKKNDIPFINIDMEHVSDYDVTIDAFKKVYSKKKYLKIPVGFVIQAYLKTSFKTFKSLEKWSENRIKKGGKRLKIRLVKGANFLEEKQRCIMNGWESFTFKNKLETDANFKKLLYEWSETSYKSISLGFATHNIFDISLGICIFKRCKTPHYFQFELLYGMNPPLQKILIKNKLPLVIYTPYCHPKKIHESIPYLIRRLDEQSLKDHFMKKAAFLRINTKDWKCLENQFIESFKLMNLSKKEKSRSLEKTNKIHDKFLNSQYEKWYRRSDQVKINKIIEKMYECSQESVKNINKLVHVKRYKKSFFPNIPLKVAYKIPLMNLNTCEKKIKYLHKYQRHWQQQEYRYRKKIIDRFMKLIVKNRNTIISCIMADVAKNIDQADTEVAEAIDFCKYYISQSNYLYKNFDHCKPLGICMIVPPWNFPFAIAIGGITAALLTGNSVLFKPAHESYAISCMILNYLKQAGIPDSVFQMISFDEEKIGEKIITHSYIDKIILTGSSMTAEFFLKYKPDLQIQAETGGKNMMVISDLCDKDQAINALLESAFSYSGQKCSATSLVCLIGSESYKKDFYERLVESAKQLSVNVSSKKESVITPLVQNINVEFTKELSRLQKGQSWLLKPGKNKYNKNLWSPGIKLGITKKHSFFKRECFAPLIGIMCTKNLKEAVSLINDNPYALTSSLFSLCPNQQSFFKDNVESGNVYINKASVGAMVARHPFGGWKKSAYGWGHKAGGLYYLYGFLKQINSRKNNFYFKKTSLERSDQFVLDIFINESKRIIDKHLKPMSCVSYRGEKNTLFYHPYHQLLIIDNNQIDQETVYKWIKIAQFWGIKIVVINPTLNSFYRNFKSSITMIQEKKIYPSIFKQSRNILIRSNLNIDQLWLENLKQKIKHKGYIHIERSHCHSIALNEVVKFAYSKLVSENIQRFGRLKINIS